MHVPQAHTLGHLLVLHLASVIEPNKNTLQVMVRTPKALFDCADGLYLEEFSPTEDVLLADLKAVEDLCSFPWGLDVNVALCFSEHRC